MKKVLITLVMIFLLAYTSCSSSKLIKKNLTITCEDGRTYSLLAEMAVSPEEREHGFMGRKHIPDGTGMLFIFETDQKLSFWMKNTPHPLSIAYIDSRGKIRDIFDMTPFSLATIQSTVSVRYALEVPQGWFKKNNIQTGDHLTLDF